MEIIDFINTNIFTIDKQGELFKIACSNNRLQSSMYLHQLGFYEKNIRLISKMQAMLPDWQNVICDALLEMFKDDENKKKEIEALRNPKTNNPITKQDGKNDITEDFKGATINNPIINIVSPGVGEKAEVTNTIYKTKSVSKISMKNDNQKLKKPE